VKLITKEMAAHYTEWEKQWRQQGRQENRK